MKNYTPCTYVHIIYDVARHFLRGSRVYNILRSRLNVIQGGGTGKFEIVRILEFVVMGAKVQLRVSCSRVRLFAGVSTTDRNGTAIETCSSISIVTFRDFGVFNRESAPHDLRTAHPGICPFRTKFQICNALSSPALPCHAMREHNTAIAKRISLAFVDYPTQICGTPYPRKPPYVVLYRYRLA